jgi:hypothetical protein
MVTPSLRNVNKGISIIDCVHYFNAYTFSFNSLAFDRRGVQLEVDHSSRKWISLWFTNIPIVIPDLMGIQPAKIGDKIPLTG